MLGLSPPARTSPTVLCCYRPGFLLKRRYRSRPDRQARRGAPFSLVFQSTWKTYPWLGGLLQAIAQRRDIMCLTRLVLVRIDANPKYFRTADNALEPAHLLLFPARGNILLAPDRLARPSRGRQSCRQAQLVGLSERHFSAFFLA